MKKLSIAALVLAAFSCGAQAQSNVTIYGLVDLGLTKTTNIPVTNTVRENKPSRLGFRGTEDLGGKLSAIFNLEMEIRADTGLLSNAALFDRQANVGLKGEFGTVILGRTKNIVDGAQGRIDPFGADGIIGKRNEALMRVGVSDSRVSNAVTYSTPNTNGFVGSVQYQAAEASGGGAGLDLLVTYDQGPLGLHAGYERALRKSGERDEGTMWVVAGSYKIGDAKLSAQTAKGDTKVATKGKFKAIELGLSYKLGAGDVRATWAKQTKDALGVSTDSGEQFGLGYDYPMSKRTALYAYAGREKVLSQSSLQIGVTHRF